MHIQLRFETGLEILLFRNRVATVTKIRKIRKIKLIFTFDNFAENFFGRA